MNNIVSFSRLRLLLNKQWFEHRKVYLSSIVILFGFLFMLYAYNLTMTNRLHFEKENSYDFINYSQLRFRTLLFTFSGIVYLSVFAGNYFSAYGKSNRAIQVLTLPVSTAEKFIASLISVVLLTTVTFLLTFFAVDALFVLALRSIYNQVIVEQATFFHRANEKGFLYLFQVFGTKEFTVSTLAGLLSSSTFLVGSIYFSKLSYVKTAFILVVFFLLSTAIPTLISNIWYKDSVYVVDYTQANQPKEIFFKLSVILVIISLWTATYCRLGEKEI